MILAPLRGVTIRCFREVFAEQIREAGFTEAITPFISANPGFNPLKDRELANVSHRDTKTQNINVALCDPIKVTPQFIGKGPESLRECLLRIKEAGFDTADLNCGCPYPMVRNKGRGSGLLRTPAVLEKMIAVGCETMGEGNFSVKTRLGFDKNDELLALMPMLNSYPLRFLTVHARNARQMYGGECDWESFKKVAAVAKMPIVPNGDLPLQPSISLCDQNCKSGISHKDTEGDDRPRVYSPARDARRHRRDAFKVHRRLVGGAVRPFASPWPNEGANCLLEGPSALEAPLADSQDRAHH